MKRKLGIGESNMEDYLLIGDTRGVDPKAWNKSVALARTLLKLSRVKYAHVQYDRSEKLYTVTLTVDRGVNVVLESPRGQRWGIRGDANHIGTAEDARTWLLSVAAFAGD